MTIYFKNNNVWEELHLIDPPSMNSRIPNPDQPIVDGGLWSYTINIRLQEGLIGLLGWNPLRPHTFKKRRLPILIALQEGEYTGYLYCDRILYDADIPALEGSITMKEGFWEALQEPRIQDPAENGIVPDLRAVELRDLQDLWVNVKDELSLSRNEYSSIRAMLNLFDSLHWARLAILFRGTYNLSYPYQDKNSLDSYTSPFNDNFETVREGTFLTREGTEWTLTEYEVCLKVDSVIQAICNYLGVSYLSIGDLSEFEGAYLTPLTIQQWPKIWRCNYSYNTINGSWISNRDPRSQINVDWIPGDNGIFSGWATEIADYNPLVFFPWIYFDGDTRMAAIDNTESSYMYYFNKEGHKGTMKLSAQLPPTGQHYSYITVSEGLTASPNTVPGRWWIVPIANGLEYTFDYELFEGEWLRVAILEEGPTEWLCHHKCNWEILPEKFYVEDTSQVLDYRWDDITDDYYTVKPTNFNGVNLRDLLNDLFLTIRKPPYFLDGNLSCNTLPPLESTALISPNISMEANPDKIYWISKPDEDRLDALQKIKRETPVTEELKYIAPAFKHAFNINYWHAPQLQLQQTTEALVSISNKDDWNDRLEIDLVEAGQYLPFNYNKLYSSGDKVRFKGRYYSLIVPGLRTFPDFTSGLSGLLYTHAPMPGKIWSLYTKRRSSAPWQFSNYEPISGNPWAEDILTIDTSRTYLQSCKLITIQPVTWTGTFVNDDLYGEGFTRFHPYGEEIQEYNWLDTQFLLSLVPIPKTDVWGTRVEVTPVNWPGWVAQTFENAWDKDNRNDTEPVYEWEVKINGREFWESSTRPMYVRWWDDIYIVTELTEWDSLTGIARVKARRLWD